MGVPECRKSAILLGKVGQSIQTPGNLGQEDVEAVFDHDQVGVVGDEAGGGAQVDDALGLGTGGAEGVDVGHHIVFTLALFLLGDPDQVQNIENMNIVCIECFGRYLSTSYHFLKVRYNFLGQVLNRTVLTVSPNFRKTVFKT